MRVVLCKSSSSSTTATTTITNTFTTQHEIIIIKRQENVTITKTIFNNATSSAATGTRHIIDASTAISSNTQSGSDCSHRYYTHNQVLLFMLWMLCVLVVLPDWIWISTLLTTSDFLHYYARDGCTWFSWWWYFSTCHLKQQSLWQFWRLVVLCCFSLMLWPTIILPYGFALIARLPRLKPVCHHDFLQCYCYSYCVRKNRSNDVSIPSLYTCINSCSSSYFRSVVYQHFPLDGYSIVIVGKDLLSTTSLTLLSLSSSSTVFVCLPLLKYNNNNNNCSDYIWCSSSCRLQEQEVESCSVECVKSEISIGLTGNPLVTWKSIKRNSKLKDERCELKKGKRNKIATNSACISKTRQCCVPKIDKECAHQALLLLKEPAEAVGWWCIVDLKFSHQPAAALKLGNPEPFLIQIEKKVKIEQHLEGNKPTSTRNIACSNTAISRLLLLLACLLTFYNGSVRELPSCSSLPFFFVVLVLGSLNDSRKVRGESKSNKSPFPVRKGTFESKPLRVFVAESTALLRFILLLLLHSSSSATTSSPYKTSHFLQSTERKLCSWPFSGRNCIREELVDNNKHVSRA